MALKVSNKNRPKIITPAKHNHIQVEAHLNKVLSKKQSSVKSNKPKECVIEPKYNSYGCWISFSIVFLAVLLII